MKHVLKRPCVVTGLPEVPEFFDVDFNATAGYDAATARRGKAMSLPDLPQSLTTGSPRVWFQPRPNATGNLTGCCSKRWCQGSSGLFEVVSTCVECSMAGVDSTRDTLIFANFCT
jgi:hypothetical protein